MTEDEFLSILGTSKLESYFYELKNKHLYIPVRAIFQGDSGYRSDITTINLIKSCYNKFDLMIPARVHGIMVDSSSIYAYPTEDHGDKYYPIDVIKYDKHQYSTRFFASYQECLNKCASINSTQLHYGKPSVDLYIRMVKDLNYEASVRLKYYKELAVSWAL